MFPSGGFQKELNKTIYFKMNRPIKEGGADAVDFRTQTKIKIYSFNFKDPSRFNFVS